MIPDTDFPYGFYSRPAEGDPKAAPSVLALYELDPGESHLYESIPVKETTE